jgi:hypothetical protein
METSESFEARSAPSSYPATKRTEARLFASEHPKPPVDIFDPLIRRRGIPSAVASRSYLCPRIGKRLARWLI